MSWDGNVPPCKESSWPALTNAWNFSGQCGTRGIFVTRLAPAAQSRSPPTESAIGQIVSYMAGVRVLSSRTHGRLAVQGYFGGMTVQIGARPAGNGRERVWFGPSARVTSLLGRPKKESKLKVRTYCPKDQDNAILPLRDVIASILALHPRPCRRPHRRPPLRTHGVASGTRLECP